MQSRFEVTVTFEAREDGGLRVWSPDVPLFVLSGHDPKAVLNNFEPALTAIVADMLGVDEVELHKLLPFSEREALGVPEPHQIPTGTRKYSVAA